MDRQLEGRAAELYQRQKYGEAADIYTQCLEIAKEQTDRVIVLLNRASCYLKQSRYAEALADCDEILKDEPTNEKALWKKIKVLCFQGSFQDAHDLATEWLQKDPGNALASKELQRLEIFMGCSKDKGEERVSSEESSNNSARSYSTVAAANSNNSSPQYSAVVSGAQASSPSITPAPRDGHTTQSLNPYATEFVPRWQH